MDIFFRDFTDKRNKELVSDACEDYSMTKEGFNSVCDLQYNSYADEDRKAKIDTIESIMIEKKEYWMRTNQYDETENREVYSCQTNFEWFINMIKDFFSGYDNIEDEIDHSPNFFAKEVHDNLDKIRKFNLNTLRKVIKHHESESGLEAPKFLILTRKAS